MTKTIFPLDGDPIYGQKLGKNSFSKKVDFVVHLKIDQNGKLIDFKRMCFVGVLIFWFWYP